MKEEFNKELQELSPFLADLKKQQKAEPFKTPRLYFDTLADKVLEKAKEEKNTAVVPPQYNQRPSLSERINIWLSTLLQPRLAFSVLGLALVVAAGWYAVDSQKAPIVSPNEQTTMAVTEAPKNNVGEMPTNDNTNVATIENRHQQSTIVDIEDPKMVENKSAVVDSQKTPNKTEITPPLIMHPKSGLTEEEIEEYLKEALADEDLENIGGK